MHFGRLLGREARRHTLATSVLRGVERDKRIRSSKVRETHTRALFQYLWIGMTTNNGRLHNSGTRTSYHVLLEDDSWCLLCGLSDL
jgi:hypothetical protein